MNFIFFFANSIFLLIIKKIIFYYNSNNLKWKILNIFYKKKKTKIFLK